MLQAFVFIYDFAFIYAFVLSCAFALGNIVRFMVCLAANFKFDVFWERVIVCEQEGCQFGPFLFRRIYLCFCLFLGLGSGRWVREHAFEEGIGGGGAAGAFLVAPLFSPDLPQAGGGISPAGGSAEGIQLPPAPPASVPAH